MIPFTVHNALERLDRALRVELAWSIAYLDSADRLQGIAEKPWWLFHGWMQQNKIAVLRFSRLTLDAVDASAGQIRLDQLEGQQREARRLQASHGPYVFFGRLVSAKLNR